jgi:c(7)-type cytochrome triheme protein
VKHVRKSWLLSAAFLMLLGLGVAVMAQQVWAQAKGPDDFQFSGGAEGKVTFSHKEHLEKSGKCTDCHTKLFKMTKGQRSSLKMADMEKGQACGSCHNGQATFSVKDKANCTKCHKK